MGRKLKRFEVALSGLAVFSLVILWVQFGEYDHRDLPSNVKVTVKSDGALKARATVIFNSSRSTLLLCTGLFGNGLNSIEENYTDIPSSGLDVRIKRKWAGLCKYEFYMMSITCSKMESQPANSNGTYESAAVGILEKPGMSKADYGHVLKSENRLIDNSLAVVGDGPRKTFFGCDSACDPHVDFGIDRSTTTIRVSCYEKSEP